MITDKQLENLDIYTLDEDALETENRMRNLMWTVSGDYSLDTKLDLAHVHETKYTAMYDAVKQGAFAKFFDKDAFALYMAKKMFCGADRDALTAIGQICVDSAVYPLILPERPGVREIRALAFSWLLDHHFNRLSQTLTGKVKLAFMRGVLENRWECEGRIRRPLELVRDLEAAGNTQKQDQRTGHLIKTVDVLYNMMIDPGFEKRAGNLEKVLAVTLEEMREVNWRDFLDEEAFEDLLEKLMEDVGQQVTSFDPDQVPEEDEEQKQQKKKRTILQVDAAAVEKMHSYIEKTFGASYLTPAQEARMNYRLCRGAHEDCALHFTDGIIDHPVMMNAQYANAVKHAKNNQRLFLNSTHIIRRNVEIMTSILKQALQARTQTDEVPAFYGNVVPRKLWKVGRVENPGRLFTITTHVRSTEYAVEILMDGSGSQRERQGQVALQAYIISASLSNIGIPHRIESFCSFWDYTVLQRFRDFDDPPSADRKVLQFTTSSNNRDGLAIRAAGDQLCLRPEENRILVVLSDGRPNDMVVNRPGSRSPAPYCSDLAVQDTAFEVRKLRGEGIWVLGVFTGKEKDLNAEKKIFGRDFAYVRDIRNFSKVVGVYMRRLLEQD